MNKAILSIWRSDCYDNGRKLEGIVGEGEVDGFIKVMLPGFDREKSVSVDDTDLPKTHIKMEDGSFRHLPL